MTKRNLLLVSLILVFGLATASSLFAQVGTTFNVSNNTNYDARNEGDAEGVGTVTLTTSVTGTIKASSYIAVDYNVPIAHNGSLYAVGITWLGDTNNCEAASTVTIGTYAFHSTPSYPPLPGISGNEVFIRFTSDCYPAAGMTINVASRVMVEGYKAGFTIAATVRANSAVAGVPLTVAPAYDAAFIVADLNGPATTVTLKVGPEYVLTCLGVKHIHGTAYTDDFTLNIMENWPNALTSLSDEWSIENNDINNKTTGTPVWPSNGSNIDITLFHIPPGVTITAETPVPCWEFDTSAVGYCNDGEALIIETPVAEPMTTDSAGNGTQNFFYVIDSTNTGVVENADFGFQLSSQGPLPPTNAYTPYVITAQVSLIDAYPANGPVDMPYFTLPENQPMLVVEFKDCVTKLLFPWVTTYVTPSSRSAVANWGTGIQISNTTVDPFGLTFTAPGSPANCPNSNQQDPTGLCYPDEAKGSAQPQSGSCTLYLYPANPAIAITPWVTPNIAAGASFAFDLSTQVPSFSGLQGYAIAVCGFQNAHAFVQVYDNFGISDPTATLGYQAEVLPDPAFYHRSPAGDGLGEGAVAPINIEHFIRKLLMCGPSLCH
jgi:hypothetical protein